VAPSDPVGPVKPPRFVELLRPARSPGFLARSERNPSRPTPVSPHAHQQATRSRRRQGCGRDVGVGVRARRGSGGGARWGGTGIDRQRLERVSGWQAVWMTAWLLNVDRASNRADAFVRAASRSQGQSRRRRPASTPPSASNAPAAAMSVKSRPRRLGRGLGMVLNRISSAAAARPTRRRSPAARPRMAKGSRRRGSRH